MSPEQKIQALTLTLIIVGALLAIASGWVIMLHFELRSSRRHATYLHQSLDRMVDATARPRRRSHIRIIHQTGENRLVSSDPVTPTAHSPVVMSGRRDPGAAATVVIARHRHER